MTYLVATDASLARILGVSRAAIQKAAADGKIERGPDGWDLFDTVRRWRQNTSALLQRPHRCPFRPWLDVSLPFRGSLVVELRRRAVVEGAERVGDDWDEDGADFEEEDLEGEDDGED